MKILLLALIFMSKIPLDGARLARAPARCYIYCEHWVRVICGGVAWQSPAAYCVRLLQRRQGRR
jgi:hypothetical protein